MARNMKREEREAAIVAVTNDLLTSKFTTELGSKAIVDRTSISSEHLDQLRNVIADVGRDLQKIGAVPKGMTYIGSLSVHVYTSAILKNAAFATCSPTDNLPSDLADGALRELTGSTMLQYGKKRQTQRSGF